MKAIQITFDERLLEQLDADPEVKRDGRSAVLRRAVAAYLKRKRGREIDARLERGYKKYPPGEHDVWLAEGAWPED